MQKPISLKIDYTVNAGYIAYRELAEGEHCLRNDRVSEDVVADYDANSTIVGIELLSFDGEALEVARKFAETRGLDFPGELEANNPVPA